ncbi:THAP domain-containing protein 4 [Cichlidogyrus casuarinus]|uniref:THAP domain-containing protein 4 n=1 Tax=Cichlidogyrus casuarinus TaxID=1844966 RepID=A0ABD2PUE7_9PLAT
MPKHRESGFLKLKPSCTDVALMLSENTGISSCLAGNMVACDSATVEKGCLLCIELESNSILGSSFNKAPAVVKVKRLLLVKDEETLLQKVYMATTNTPDLTQHLEITYKRVKTD